MPVNVDGKTTTYSCREVIPGKASGEAIVSPEAMCMYLCDPKTGVVIEKGHPLEGRSISGKILVLKSGKGSSVVQLDGFYQLSVKSNLPAAIIVYQIEPVLVSSAVVVGTPMVDRMECNPYEVIEDGDWVEVDPAAGMIRVTKKS